MYAVFQLNGFQYTAEPGATVRVPYVRAEKGSNIEISEVLMIKSDDREFVGSPFVPDARIEAEVIDHGQADKVLVYKYKKRTKYRRRRGQRQKYSEIRISRIAAPEE